MCQVRSGARLNRVGGWSARVEQAEDVVLDDGQAIAPGNVHDGRAPGVIERAVVGFCRVGTM